MSSEVTFMKGNNLRLSRGIVFKNIGLRPIKIFDPEDGSIHYRHYSQVNYNAAPLQEKIEEERDVVTQTIKSVYQAQEYADIEWRTLWNESNKVPSITEEEVSST